MNSLFKKIFPRHNNCTKNIDEVYHAALIRKLAYIINKGLHQTDILQVHGYGLYKEAKKALDNIKTIEELDSPDVQRA